METSTLAQQIDGKNNLNALRLALSLMVIFSHCFPLALGVTTFSVAGEIAVITFFFISGMLITASWLRSTSALNYLRNRVLRIYPGFIVALILSCVAATVSNPALGKYYLSLFGLISIAMDCLTLSLKSLQGSAIFHSNPLPGYANGALWTIPIEFQCYILVCVLGLCRLFKYRWLLVVTFLCLYASLCFSILHGQANILSTRRLMVYFIAGVCAWLWRDKIPLRLSLAFASLTILAATLAFKIPLTLTAPFALSYLALFAGYAKPLNALRWCDRTDLSYGVYPYAFPIQQLLALNLAMRNPWLMFASATPLSLMAAFASWHLVEKRFLRMRKRQVVSKEVSATKPLPALPMLPNSPGDEP